MKEEVANGVGTHEGAGGVPENMRKQLAVAVRSIQWSYAIFWSLSPTRQGVLQWGDGYYNGDIKTRKTVQEGDLISDMFGLQRSEQLRLLYKSLHEGESKHSQSKRPSASLSPEDLTDEEWYYLVCMSFVFNPGEDLPGRALANGNTIWLCNAQYADSKIFPRSLLAKSASIQTVVCFPYLGGIVELGVTELVQEDPSVLQHIKVALLNFSKPLCAEKSSFDPHNRDHERDPTTVTVDPYIDDVMFENLFSSTERINAEERIAEPSGNAEMEITADSLDECSNGCEHNHETEDSFMVEGINGESWHFFEDDFSNGFPCSMNSSDCISEAVVNPEKTNPESSKNLPLKELQICSHSKLSSLELGQDDDVSHYRKTISTIIMNSQPSNETLILRCGWKSSFVNWRRFEGHNIPQDPQKVLKRILFKVPLMFKQSRLKKEHNSMLSVKNKENEKFLLLGSMIPSLDQIDKAVILNNTIVYLKELEARVEELESCMESNGVEGQPARRKFDFGEQISDNYKNSKLTDGKKRSRTTKRKAYNIDETENPEFNEALPVEGQQLDLNLKVQVEDREVLIEMRCPYQEYLLLDIMEAINNLHLDAHFIQSATHDGALTLTLKSKFRGAAISPSGMIKQALQNVIGSS